MALPPGYINYGDLPYFGMPGNYDTTVLPQDVPYMETKNNLMTGGVGSLTGADPFGAFASGSFDWQGNVNLAALTEYYYKAKIDAQYRLAELDKQIQLTHDLDLRNQLEIDKQRAEQELTQLSAQHGYLMQQMAAQTAATGQLNRQSSDLSLRNSMRQAAAAAPTQEQIDLARSRYGSSADYFQNLRENGMYTPQDIIDQEQAGYMDVVNETKARRDAALSNFAANGMAVDPYAVSAMTGGMKFEAGARKAQIRAGLQREQAQSRERGAAGYLDVAGQLAGLDVVPTADRILGYEAPISAIDPQAVVDAGYLTPAGKQLTGGQSSYNAGTGQGAIINQTNRGHRLARRRKQITGYAGSVY